MNELEADELFDQLLDEYPDAKVVDGRLYFQPSYGAAIYLTLRAVDATEIESCIDVLYIFPPLFHLNLDRKIEKAIKKMNKGSLGLTGYTLAAEDGSPGLLLYLTKSLSPEVKTIEQFREFRAELSIKTLAIYMATSNLPSNKWN